MVDKTPEALALEKLANDITLLEEEEAQCARILEATKQDGFKAEVAFSTSKQYRVASRDQRDRGPERVAGLLGDLLLDHVPRLVEAVLSKRRAEVQEHRDRVLAMYKGGGGAERLERSPLRLAILHD